MSVLLGLLAVVAVLVGLAIAFARADSRQATQALRIVLGVGGLLIGALLTLRGLAIAGIPIITAALGFLGVAVRGGGKTSGESGEGTGSGDRRASGRGPSMSRKEAAEILGVPETADEATVRAAYRKLMKQVHPDAGGNDALAARVQAARDVLLGKP